MSKNTVFSRILGVARYLQMPSAQKGLGAGFFALSSLFSFLSGSESVILGNLVKEVSRIETAVAEESPAYSPKGLGEHYRITGEISYIVQSGDNIYTIARDMKKDGVWIKPKQIIEWNNLVAPQYVLQPGRTLTLYNLMWEPQIVEASWYGPGFHGKPMANTRIFNQNDLVAAHMYLPLGMDVRVTNITNGKSIVVPVTDRGDFEKYQRGIDLSKQAAKVLGYHGAGTTQVLVEPLQ